MFPGFLRCITDLFACVYTQGTLIYSLIQRTFVFRSPYWISLQKSLGTRRPQSLACNCQPSTWWPFLTCILHSLLRVNALTLCHQLTEWLSHHVTAVAHKRSQSFCRKCGWQVTAKYVCTLHMWFCMKWRDKMHGCMVYAKSAKMAAVSGNTSQVTTKQRSKYTTLVDIQKCC